MLPRERTEELEEKNLAPGACRSARTRGRERAEKADDLRTEFQRDRDRIIHAKSFRRLKHKTQVFFSPSGDHYRVRLTHTLEVSQIARTIARALALNEDLAEAISLGHDLGHTPFGHIGEDALSDALGRPFQHSLQSLRVVDYLEYEGRGLNLTFEVRDGIANHTWTMPKPATKEAEVVRLSDRIAYLNHDLDDAIRAGLVSPDDVPSGVLEKLGRSHSRRIATLVSEVVSASSESSSVRMGSEISSAMDELREFMFARVYLHPAARAEQGRAAHVIKSLFDYFLEHFEELPAEYRQAPGDEGTRVADYVAGMTDRYAVTVYEGKFVPRYHVG
ncbi:MAG: deoxyguanosinetriphosphate triphosphohydrolase [Actinomycetota bacterium]